MMRLHQSAYVTLPVLALVITGCAKKELSCSDEETLGLVKNMIVEQSASLNPQPDYFFKTVKNPDGFVEPYFPTMNSIRFENIRLKSISKDTGKIECEADTLVDVPKTYVSVIAESNKSRYLQQVKPDSYQLRLPVEYTSQPTEDKKKYVQAGGLNIVRDVFDMVLIHDQTMKNFIDANKGMMMGLAGWRSCGSQVCTFHDNASNKDFDIVNIGAIDSITSVCPPEIDAGLCKMKALVKGDKIYYVTDVSFQ